ncbi:unnamed protein product [Sympodiomycopsis kandeliae]
MSEVTSPTSPPSPSPSSRSRLISPDELMAMVVEMRLAATSSSSSSSSKHASDTLDLCHKNIQDIPSEFVQVIQHDIVRLALGYNTIYSLPATLVNLTKLRYLNVRTNIIASFPQVLCEMPCLEILDISRNKIRKLPSEPGNLLNLRVLCLSHNRIRRLPQWVAKMQKVRILKIDDNPIQWPPPHVSMLSKVAAGAPLAPSPSADKNNIKKNEEKMMQSWIVALKKWMIENPEVSSQPVRYNDFDAGYQQQQPSRKESNYSQSTQGQQSNQNTLALSNGQANDTNEDDAHLPSTTPTSSMTTSAATPAQTSSQHHRGKSSLTSAASAYSYSSANDNDKDNITTTSPSIATSYPSSTTSTSFPSHYPMGASYAQGQQIPSQRNEFQPSTVAIADDGDASIVSRASTPSTYTSPIRTSPERSFRMRPLVLARTANPSSSSPTSSSTPSTATIVPTSTPAGIGNQSTASSPSDADLDTGSSPHSFSRRSHSAQSNRQSHRHRRHRQYNPSSSRTSFIRHQATDSESSSVGMHAGLSSASSLDARLSSLNLHRKQASDSSDAQRDSSDEEEEEDDEEEENDDDDDEYDQTRSRSFLASSFPEASSRDTLLAPVDGALNNDHLTALHSDGSLFPGSVATISPSRSVTPTPFNLRRGDRPSEEESFTVDASPLQKKQLQTPPRWEQEESSANGLSLPVPDEASSALSSNLTTPSASSRNSATPRNTFSSATLRPLSQDETLTPESSTPMLNGDSRGSIVPPQSSLALQPALGLQSDTSTDSQEEQGPAFDTQKVQELPSLPSFDRPPRRAPPTPSTTEAGADRPLLSSHGRNKSHSFGQPIPQAGQVLPPSAQRRLLKSKKSLPDMKSDVSSRVAMTRDLSSHSGYGSSSQHSAWSLASSHFSGSTPSPSSTVPSTPKRPLANRPQLQHAATMDGSGMSGFGVPLLPALDVATQSARKFSAPAITQHEEHDKDVGSDAQLTDKEALHDSPAQVLEQRRADVLNSTTSAVKPSLPHSETHGQLQRTISRRRKALIGAAGLSDDEAGPVSNAQLRSHRAGVAALEGASQESQRDSYFKRFSTFNSLVMPPTVPTVASWVLKQVDATRGILFALSQIYSALKQYTLFTKDERVSAQLGRVLDVAAGTLATLIDSLDRFDSFNLRGQCPNYREVVDTVIDSSKDSIQIFRKVVNVLKLQLKPLQDSADVRYTRNLILMLYGAMTEVFSSWKEICASREDGGEDASQNVSTSAMVTAPPQVQMTRPSLANATNGSASGHHGNASASAAAGNGPLPSIAESISPSNSFRRVSPPSANDDVAAETDAAGNMARSSRPQRKRHAGSFSANDVRSGSLMPAALSNGELPPPLPNGIPFDGDVLSEFRGPPSARRPFARRVATDTGMVTQGQQLSAASMSNGSRPSGQHQHPMSSRSISNPQGNGVGAHEDHLLPLPHSTSASGIAAPREQMQSSRPIIDHHLLSLIQQVTSTASGVWVALLEHLASQGVRSQSQQYHDGRLSRIGSPDCTPTLSANRIAGKTGLAQSTLSPPGATPGTGSSSDTSPLQTQQAMAARSVSPFSSTTGVSTPHSGSNRKLHDLRDQCISAAELTRRLQHTWERVQDEVDSHNHPQSQESIPYSRALNINLSDAHRLLDESITFVKSITTLLLSIKSLSITHESLTIPELKRLLSSLTLGCTNLSVHLHFCAPFQSQQQQQQQQQQVGRKGIPK